ncbi:MAG: DGQHR domain-containing protein [Candidatus Acidiferrales bacterium]
MPDKSKLEILKVPGLRAHMGDWVYYVTFLKLRDVAERVSFVRDIHTSRVLEDLIQREIDESKHSWSIKQYLLHQRQRFFNGLVIGVYGGAPSWTELNVDDTSNVSLDALPTYIRGALGILTFSGTEQLFAIDGQHRVAGIKKAVEARKQLGNEEICALFISHRNDRQGLQRTRRLFTTLNRYAKPVSKMEIIALDEDDVLAIITRRLVEGHPLFRERVSRQKGKAISKSDRRNVTSIVSLYDSLDIFFRTRPPRLWREFRKMRPGDSKIREYYQRAERLWAALIACFPELAEVANSRPDEELVGKYRNRSGGHLIFRPVGLEMIVWTVRIFLDQGKPLGKIVKAISRVPMDLAQAPWAGLLWDPVNHRMTVAGENQQVARRLMFYGLGGDLKVLKITRKQLREEWGGILNRRVRLPRWVSMS